MKVLIILGGVAVWYVASLLLSAGFVALVGLLGMGEMFADELVRNIVYRVIMVLVAIPVGILERVLLVKWDDWAMMRGVLRRAAKGRRERMRQEKKNSEENSAGR